ncbi:DUF4105 domain-containing protein [bacterium]|nr:DUF4105 domain-containing protein [bacterium]
MRRPTRIILQLLAWVVLVMGAAWSMMALWFDASRNGWISGLLALAFAGACAAAIVFLKPRWRGMLAMGGCIVAVIAWWNLIPPRNDRNWSPDVERLPRAEVSGNRLTVYNVRDFDYRSATDFTPRWETRTYDLGKLRGVDLFLSYWGSALICHTIASWEFEGAPPLAISIETRKEEGESYSAIRGFFRQFELYYVVADERDVIGLRTNFRGEQVYLYRIRATPAQARALLLDYARQMNRLAERPRWYNALTQNCTTTIRQHVMYVGEGRPFDWRILANGRVDELGYERGMITTSLPFTELRKRSNITGKAHAADAARDFPDRIRDGLPQ